MSTSSFSLENCVIFNGMTKKEIELSLKNLNAKEKSYRKNSTIFHAGETTDSLGLVLHGSVTIESNDIWGNRTILSNVGEGEFFAETYALLECTPLLVDVRATEDCRILFFRIGSLKNFKTNISPWRFKLMANLLMISSHKNLHLSGRSFHTSPKTIRGRVMSYLNSISLQKGTKDFDIPFDRQEFSDYLNLERTALSKELGKMQRDGLIKVKKNHFTLLNNM